MIFKRIATIVVLVACSMTWMTLSDSEFVFASTGGGGVPEIPEGPFCIQDAWFQEPQPPGGGNGFCDFLEGDCLITDPVEGQPQCQLFNPILGVWHDGFCGGSIVLGICETVSCESAHPFFDAECRIVNPLDPYCVCKTFVVINDNIRMVDYCDECPVIIHL